MHFILTVTALFCSFAYSSNLKTLTGKDTISNKECKIEYKKFIDDGLFFNTKKVEANIYLGGVLFSYEAPWQYKKAILDDASTPFYVSENEAYIQYYEFEFEIRPKHYILSRHVVEMSFLPKPHLFITTQYKSGAWGDAGSRRQKILDCQDLIED